MRVVRALASGLCGSAVLTIIHETARRQIPDAPRADILAMRAIDRAMEAANRVPPTGEQLHQISMLGDFIANTLYYSLVGAGERRGAWIRGVLLGSLAGFGALLLPEVLGLGKAPTGRTRRTQLMTVAWYLLGGLASAAAYWLLSSGEQDMAALPTTTFERAAGMEAVENGRRQPLYG